MGGYADIIHFFIQHFNILNFFHFEYLKKNPKKNYSFLTFEYSSGGPVRPWFLLRRRFFPRFSPSHFVQGQWILFKSNWPRPMTFIEPVRQSVRLAKGYDRLAYMFDRLAYGFDRFNWPLRQNYLGWFSKLFAGDFLAELYRRGYRQDRASYQGTGPIKMISMGPVSFQFSYIIKYNIGTGLSISDRSPETVSTLVIFFTLNI